MAKKSAKKASKKKTTKSVSRPGAQKPSPRSGIVPLLDRVLVKPFTEEEARGTTDHFGIILPESVKEEKSAQGRVVAVGEGRMVDGKRVALSVAVGDVVIFSKYGYDEVTYKGEEFYLLKEDNILAIIN
jgi:chaperonin GroES